jgi:hypothetical protein
MSPSEVPASASQAILRRRLLPEGRTKLCAFEGHDGDAATITLAPKAGPTPGARPRARSNGFACLI